MPERLADRDLQAALPELWPFVRQGDRLVASFRGRDFRHAFAFLCAVASAAEAAGHHPDFTCRYARVDFSLWTHDSGGLTARDVQLAAQIKALAHAHGLAAAVD